MIGWLTTNQRSSSSFLHHWSNPRVVQGPRDLLSDWWPNFHLDDLIMINCVISLRNLWLAFHKKKVLEVTSFPNGWPNFDKWADYCWAWPSFDMTDLIERDRLIILLCLFCNTRLSIGNEKKSSTISHTIRQWWSSLFLGRRKGWIISNPWPKNWLFPLECLVQQ